MRRLIIGANSKLVNCLSDLNDVEIVSHKNVPSNGDFYSAYIFSYSKVLKDNINLLDKIKKLNCKKVVYISSITTLIDQKYSFNYPNIKRKCEKLARERNFEIVRIGLVIETLNNKPSNGTYAITEIGQISEMINNDKSEICSPEVTSYGSEINKKIENIYLILIKYLGSFSFILRPMDLILKIFGQNWYGYNVLAVEKIKNIQK